MDSVIIFPCYHFCIEVSLIFKEFCYHYFSFVFENKASWKECDLYLIATHQTISIMNYLQASFELGVRQKLVSFFLPETTKQARMLLMVHTRKAFAVTNSFEETIFMP